MHRDSELVGKTSITANALGDCILFFNYILFKFKFQQPVSTRHQHQRRTLELFEWKRDTNLICRWPIDFFVSEVTRFGAINHSIQYSLSVLLGESRKGCHREVAQRIQSQGYQYFGVGQSKMIDGSLLPALLGLNLSYVSVIGDLDSPGAEDVT